ncbi:hypothetical protein ACROYT_G039418 [Oculina patagonica]
MDTQSTWRNQLKTNSLQRKAEILFVNCRIREVLKTLVVLTTFQSKLVKLTPEVERLVYKANEIGSGFYDLQELSTIMSRLTELTQEVERLMNVDEESSTIGSGSGLFQREKEEGSAAPCNPEVLSGIRLRLNELIREVKRFANAPKPSVDPTTEPLNLIDQVCPHGWAHHGHSCFHIIDTPTLKWNNARTMCRQLGGDLGKITTSSENQFIYNLLRKQTTVTHYGVWLGLHRKADSQFYWVDDTPLTDYTAWGSGEPNNNGGGENCVHKIGDKRNWPFNAGEWNDVPCSLSGIVPSEIAPVVLCQKQIDTNILSF